MEVWILMDECEEGEMGTAAELVEAHNEGVLVVELSGAMWHHTMRANVVMGKGDGSKAFCFVNKKE